jgi:hypothetical protein
MLNHTRELGLINYADEHSLPIELADNKKILEFLKRTYHKEKRNREFQDCMHKIIQGVDTNSAIYQEIEKLKAVFITTNSDTHFDSFFNPRDICVGIDLETLDKLDARKFGLFKVHGCVTQPKTMIFTYSDYLRDYKPEAALHKFHQRIFNKYRCLFLGVSLSEIEILQYAYNADKVRHYWLKDYFQSQNSLLNYERSFYRRIGIEIIPYFKDDLGYGALEVIIQDIASAFNVRTAKREEKLGVIDEFIRN